MTVPDHLVDAIREAHELGHGVAIAWDATPDVVIEQLRGLYNELSEAVEHVWVLAGRPCEYEPPAPMAVDMTMTDQEELDEEQRQEDYRRMLREA